MTPEKAFGSVLSELRKGKNLSQDKVSSICDLDRTYISLLERGLRQPSLTTFLNLSKALDISPSDFITLVVQRMESDE